MKKKIIIISIQFIKKIYFTIKRLKTQYHRIIIYIGIKMLNKLEREIKNHEALKNKEGLYLHLFNI